MVMEKNRELLHHGDRLIKKFVILERKSFSDFPMLFFGFRHDFFRQF